ncbi:MAG: choice-of-anchor Q domain-containing protein [Myxococcales bacterium]|nr:hypothetical protein [Myxococcota bacterium]MDW8280270.1 choice-of-anchor Q domain-containing protein [Myxococcales bacterium]
MRDRLRCPAVSIRLAALALVAAGGCLEDVSQQQPPVPVIQCRVTADCKDARAGICDPVSYLCRACRGPEDDARCRERDPQTPVCGEGGVCAACAGAGESQSCIDRDPKRPTCRAGQCVACASGLDCHSGICRPDGSCGSAADTIFVDNKNGTCDATRTHAGTAQDPLCDVQAGVDRARVERKPYVRVAGSKTPYPPVTVNATSMADLLIAGVPTGTDLPVLRGDSAALSVVGAATRVAVAAQGLDFASDNADGVVCDQRTGTVMPELTLRRSRILRAARVGLVASRCRLVVDGLLVTQGSQGGLRLSNAAYVVQNIMVLRNLGPGVFIEAAQMGSTIRFATIGYNAFFGPAPGVDCNNQPFLVEHSIVVNNVGSSSQFRGCRLINVVTGSEMIMGGTAKNPEFVRAEEPLDLHLKPSAANQDCCIDKVPMAMGLPTHDIDGTPRPQGAAWDIGAHEVVR